MEEIGLVDVAGYLAAGATLVAFAQRDMLPMRISALTANGFFVAYGLLGGFYPVLVLHLILLPLNAKRLWDQVEASRPARKARPATLLEEWKASRTERQVAWNRKPLGQRWATPWE